MTLDVTERADRHMRPDPQQLLAPAEERTQGSVRVVVQPGVAESYAGQHSAWMLVSLLARQFNLVARIEVEAPEVALLPGVTAFGNAGTLGETLRECAKAIGGDHLSVANSTDDAIDIELVIGGILRTQPCNKRWYLHAEGWRWYVGQTPFSDGSPSSNRIAIGPHLAACFAAGEVFKLLRGLKPGRGQFIETLYGSAWSGGTATSWRELDDGPSLDNYVLPHLYFAGCGAVAQACLFTLGASGLQGSLTAIDHDILDTSNDNRYILSMASDHGESKVAIASHYLKNTKLTCIPVPAKWDVFVRAPKPEWISENLQIDERAHRYPIVLSGVDKNLSRHEIQNALPRLIVGGSTDGLAARAQSFDLGSETACLKCFNPLEDTVAIAHAKIEEARQGDEAAREAIRLEIGISAEELARVMEATGCGKLTPADIERFGAGPRQMSVGFVSIAAGVLQVAQLLRNQLLGRTALDGGNLTVIAFSNGRIGTFQRKRESSCDCGEERRQRWREWWKL